MHVPQVMIRPQGGSNHILVLKIYGRNYQLNIRKFYSYNEIIKINIKIVKISFQSTLVMHNHWYWRIVSYSPSIPRSSHLGSESFEVVMFH